MQDRKQPSVLHPTDLHPDSAAAFAHALKVALCAKSDLTIFHVERAEREIPWEDFPGVRQTLAKWRIIPEGSPGEAVLQAGIQVRKKQRSGEEPVQAILDHVALHKTDLIVVSTHQRHGLGRWVHRAIAEPVARESHTDTLFVPSGVRGFVDGNTGGVTLQRILIAVDFRPDPEAAVDAAVALGRLLGCPALEIHLLHAGERQDMPSAAVETEPGWVIHRAIRAGGTVDTILKEAEAIQADLIVMTTEGHHGFLDAVRGSTTEQVLRSAHCPVLAVPASPA